MPETIFGLPGAVFLLWTSAFFYLIALTIFLGPFRKEKTELMIAFFAFLAGMASFHALLGAGFYWNNLLLIHIGSFGALTGAAYTIKFPLISLRESTRGWGFYGALTIAWSIVAWMLIFPHETQTMLLFVLGYMIVFTGSAGLFMIWKGLRTKENGLKVKCAGGGLGLVTCCLVADLFVLFAGVTILGEVFMSVAPLLLITAVLLGRNLQKKTAAVSPVSLKPA